MNREAAAALVAARSVGCRVEHVYRVVRHADALELLGEDRLAQMLADRVRSLGPAVDVYYYWNVIDYLTSPEDGGIPAPIPNTAGVPA